MLCTNDSQSQYCPSIFDDPTYHYTGIQTETPDKPLHIFSNGSTCQEATIKLSYQNDPVEYLGIITLFNPSTVNFGYTKINTRTDKDFIFYSHPKAKNIILTTRNEYGHIRFATTPSQYADDIERMTISPIGNIGISNSDPQELIHIKDYLTIHSNSTYSFFALNMKVVDGQKKSINTSNKVSALEFKNSGDIYLVSAGSTTGDASASYNETNGGLKGIHLRNNAKAEIGIGREALSNTRLAVKGLTNDEESNIFWAEKQSSSIALVVKGNGKVGIGTSSPKELLQIGDEMFFQNGGTKSFIINGYYNAAQNKTFNITNRISLSIGASAINATDPGVTFMVDKQDANNPVFVFADYDLDLKGFRILPNGNFGIGKWTPESAFVVKSKGNTSNTSALDIRNSTNTPLLFIQDDGNIGIGVDEPLEKLVVDGTICAKEVRVSLEGAPCWPDYVFDENYNLTNITELEKYIKENKKLPEMPSANEVSTQGVEIGEMQARMLKKIEELTLYVIELKKENETIKSELNKLKK